jgi:hypothetical protein
MRNPNIDGSWTITIQPFFLKKLMKPFWGLFGYRIQGVSHRFNDAFQSVNASDSG